MFHKEKNISFSFCILYTERE
uniref:Uncharacterized protein n=1 Tax=Anguilla anguilla TaxID=7936 RepID=A0A0E9QV41_ANGAN